MRGLCLGTAAVDDPEATLCHLPGPDEDRTTYSSCPIRFQSERDQKR